MVKDIRKNPLSEEIQNYARKKASELEANARKEKETNAQAKAQPAEPRRKSNKTRRLYDDHSRMLADQAHKLTQEKRVKVSESDIIAEALDMWCRTKGVDLGDYE